MSPLPTLQGIKRVDYVCMRRKSSGSRYASGTHGSVEVGITEKSPSKLANNKIE